MTTVRGGRWTEYANRLLAAEISTLTRYYDRLVQYARLDYDRGVRAVDRAA